MQVDTNTIPDRSRPGLTTTATGSTSCQGVSGVKATDSNRCNKGRGKEARRYELRIGTLNVGSMTGRGREVADLMERRKVNILCVQETKWKGAKAKHIGGGFKLFYNGSVAKRNGVGIILCEDLVEKVIEVSRISDRIIWMRLEVNREVINMVSTYAPQTGCSKEDKDEFWNDMDETFSKIKPEERLYIGADFNGHIGKGNVGYERWLGKYGFGQRNDAGEDVLQFAVRAEMTIVNTYFKKPDEHLITYKSGGRATQTDYILCWRKNLKEILDCKVVPGESVTTQHRMVVCRMNLGPKRKREMRGNEPKTRWWRLKDDILKDLFVNRVQDALGESYPKDWNTTASTIREIASEILGKSSGKAKTGRETWWWNNKVQEAIKKKKEAWINWSKKRDEISREDYRSASKMSKKMVAKAKAETYKKLYEDMETDEGQKSIYRIAKQRDRAGKDVQHMKMIKDEGGRVLTEDDKIRERWKCYFEKLMNEENERDEQVIDQVYHEKLASDISTSEIFEAMQRTKSGKAVGPDDIPIEAWKYLGVAAGQFLCWLFNDILQKERMPDEWRSSCLVPVFKNKGDIQSCDNYRGIKLMSHTMKLWERVIERRLRKEVAIGDEQFGFMPGRSTTDAIFALRITAEKYREMQKELHCVFIDLEKAYDRVPREEVWHCLRMKGATEKYIRIIQDMYSESKTVVRSAVGTSPPFSVKVGLHQGSALSPFLFAIVIDQLTEGIRRRSPWNMLFADDVVLLNESKGEAEKELETWRQALESRGLRLSRSKTEYMCINQQMGKSPIKIKGHDLIETQDFKYLGSTFQADGNCEMEVKKRIQSGWLNWRKVSGLLCDKRVPTKVKGKMYKTTVRPAIMYGLEALPLTRKKDNELDVAEMRMLRWSLGLTRKDKVRNEDIRRALDVKAMSTKVRESRLRWFGHVKRRDDQYVGKRVLEIEPHGRRKRGRPKQRWMDRVRKDMEELELDEEDTQNRSKWRRCIHSSDLAQCRIS